MKFKKKMMMAWQSQRKYGALSSLGERRVIWKEETSFRGLIVKGKQEEISEFQWPQKLRVSSNQKHAPGDAAHTYHSSKSLSSTVLEPSGAADSRRVGGRRGSGCAASDGWPAGWGGQGLGLVTCGQESEFLRISSILWFYIVTRQIRA